MGATDGKAPQPSEAPHSRAARHEYSPDQIGRYLSFISLPEPHASSPLPKDRALARSAKDALPFLSSLMRHHMAKVPFENVSLHYSQGRVATLDPEELYERIVESGQGFGGYCFQQNAFFATVLRGLGFEVMTTAARVNSGVEPRAKEPNFKGPDYSVWNHMVIIATMSDRDYLVDVGMHAWGPVVPIELGFETATSISPRQIHLTRASIPEHMSRRESNEMWIFEVRNGEDQPWVPTYCFAMVEFLPGDFEALNLWVSKSKASWFSHTLICGKLLLHDSGAEVVGDSTLFGSGLRKRVHGETKQEINCQSEDERVALLREQFGIKLRPYERRAITMTEAQIP